MRLLAVREAEADRMEEEEGEEELPSLLFSTPRGFLRLYSLHLRACGERWCATGWTEAARKKSGMMDAKTENKGWMDDVRNEGRME